MKILDLTTRLTHRQKTSSPGEELVAKALDEHKLNVMHGIEDEPNEQRDALVLYIKELENSYRRTHDDDIS